ncbi:zinc ribbon domain-containing protein [Methanococcoides methylutens]|uniref:Zinc finger domain-containing protein n=1 Tax=Methanococcoides methylutens MM1 TaxID=1434104 RepID=A0A0E3SSD8_METMT|nr:zinc ribbon domain-containing protein [Methanococcoides methylutens]AKB85297.1 Zinc finger domain-containing protein [Methanococcoides methylutens MM1]
MYMEQFEGKVFCQSCGMPLEKDEDFGTNADGSKSNEYCNYCFRNGAFTQPDITLEEMIEQCSRAMDEYGIMSLEEAKKLSQQNIPKLKRWK